MGLGIILGALSGAGQGVADAAKQTQDYSDKQSLMQEQATLDQQKAQAIAQTTGAIQLSNAKDLANYQMLQGREAQAYKMGIINNAVRQAGQNAAANATAPVVSGDVDPSSPAGASLASGNFNGATGFTGNAAGIIAQIQNDPTISAADKAASLAQLKGQQKLDVTPEMRYAAAAAMVNNPATVAAVYAAIGDPAGAKDILQGAAALKNADQKFDLLNAKLENMSQNDQTKAIAMVMASANRNNATQSAIDQLKGQGASPAEIKDFLMRSTMQKQGSTYIPNSLTGVGGTEINHDTGAITEYRQQVDPVTKLKTIVPVVIKPGNTSGALRVPGAPGAPAPLQYDPATGTFK